MAKSEQRPYRIITVIFLVLSTTTTGIIFSLSWALFSTPSRRVILERSSANRREPSSHAALGIKMNASSYKSKVGRLSRTKTRLLANSSNLARSCDRNVSVLIIGYHLETWGDAVARSRDRFVRCPSTGHCVNVHYRQSRNDLNKYNVVAFSHHYMEIRNFKSSSWFQLIKRRPKTQRWVMFSLEPPVRVGLNTSVPKRSRSTSFHWTMTYDLRSDVPVPYGRYSEFSTDVGERRKFDRKSLLNSKSKGIAFLSSNCDRTRWPRTDFVRTLQRYIPIDMYGKCGDMHCGANCSDVIKQYKFVLSLENAPCKGYITEKFWGALESSFSVPIVFGPLKEDYDAIAPPGSFIHVYEFSSVRALAERLSYLLTNDTAYMEYHSWRDEGRLSDVIHDWSGLPFDGTFCALASRYQVDMKRMRDNGTVTYRDVNGVDWMDTCQIHAIRPRGSMDHLPIPEE